MKLLIVVDYQNDFVTGALGFKQAEDIKPAILEKIQKYRSNGDKILFTLDTHTDNYMDTLEGKHLPIPHCIKGTHGHKLSGINPSENDVIIEKPSFGSAELFEYLKGKNYESIELVGIVTNICVISNAIIAKAALPEIPIIIDSKCVASADDELHHKALDVMHSLQINIL